MSACTCGFDALIAVPAPPSAVARFRQCDVWAGAVTPTLLEGYRADAFLQEVNRRARRERAEAVHELFWKARDMLSRLFL